ncbi:NAD(P)-dependent dehydrogenase (short-subunit alcohol dehydrogenase family) [Melghirimyces profundicolus]|uniref:NAD(P)-dependent dehydrogenase (Short-subunit alcohol dehydrogenase family) n=1 Tax=Melghirimyces profundicolus TaxID=1242148 RepID=A0A2T6C0K8_9BACL|nr:NAD(P)-dependent dehydrogenase (short-subunit alcohol dehydrogenase family) [Melghirimyces profundicolus]
MLGRAFCQALAVCGASVAVIGRNREKLDQVVRSIKDLGGTAMGVAANVLKSGELRAARDTIEREWGPCRILVNGAGGNRPDATTTLEYHQPGEAEERERVTFFNLDPEAVASVFNLNFLGTLLPTQIFGESMVRTGKGVIINISSMNAYTPLTKIPAYSGAKAAVSNFTQWLAVHFSRSGIRVNAIAPGFFLTEQNQPLLLRDDGTYNERANKILGQTPMNRFGQPDELIGTLLWMVDEKASGFVTGIVVPVDGGFSAYSGV